MLADDDLTPFAPATRRLLGCAMSVCAAQGTRLTPMRQLVLGLVIDAARPIGAYDLLQRLSERHGPAAPPTVYRALDFLVAAGLVHKIERLSAYVACTHHLHHRHGHAAHTVQFLICTGCGRADELEDAATMHALTHAATTTGFRLSAATIEAAGLCAACAQAGGTGA